MATPKVAVKVSPAEAASELLARKSARQALIPFTTYTFTAYMPSWHHRRIAEVLESVERGETKRVICTVPPRHGKSELASIRFPAWFLGRNPDRRIIHASYAASLSTGFSRQVRNLIRSDAFRKVFPSVRLAEDSQSVEEWNLEGHRGGFKSAGVGGGITGAGADLFIIDDPVKSIEEAESELYRQRTWDWYTHDAYSRLEDDASVVVLMTRWHMDDLTGRLLEAAQESGEYWEIINFPAINENGEALWPEKYNIDDLTQMKSVMGSKAWASLYQGQPVLDEGAMFRREWFQIVPIAPADARRIRYWDKAGTEGDGDYSVGVKMAKSSDGIYYVEDVLRGRWSSDQRNKIMAQTADLDGDLVKIRMEQEPGSSGKESAAYSVKMLSGFDVRAKPVTGSKEVRAQPYAAQCEAGNVRLVRGSWNAAYIDELTVFPYGTHDDQVDGSSGAFNELSRPPLRPAYSYQG